jgi:hypothetical protein
VVGPLAGQVYYIRPPSSLEAAAQPVTPSEPVLTQRIGAPIAIENGTHDPTIPTGRYKVTLLLD